MTTATLVLPDSTNLRNVTEHDGSVTGIDSQTGRTVRFEGDPATGGRLVDSRGQLIREVVPQPQAAAVASSGRKRASTQPAGKRATDGRWAAYNAFVDQIAPRLSLAERAVWHVMFRHARDWTVSTSARRLSDAAGIDKGTASKSLLKLEKAGLVRCTWKSTDKSEASRYSMHPRPADCLPAILGSPKR